MVPLVPLLIIACKQEQFKANFTEKIISLAMTDNSLSRPTDTAITEHRITRETFMCISLQSFLCLLKSLMTANYEIQTTENMRYRKLQQKKHFLRFYAI